MYRKVILSSLYTSCMHKHGVSRKWFTETDVKYFKSDVLKTITNITRSLVKWKKNNSFTGVCQRFCSPIQKIFLKCKFLRRCFSRIFWIDKFGTTNLKMDYFEVFLFWFLLFFFFFFENFAVRLQNSYQSKKYLWKNLLIDFKTSTTSTSNNSFEGKLARNTEKLCFQFFLLSVIWKFIHTHINICWEGDDDLKRGNKYILRTM